MTTHEDLTGTEKKVVQNKFLPSANGFKFKNRFVGLPLPFQISDKPVFSKAVYGLCGGMCFTVLDFLGDGKTLPQVTNAPGRNTKLHGYLYRRQLASFGRFGGDIPRYLRWMFLPDDTDRGTWRRTYDSFRKIQPRLAAGENVVLGMVYVSIRETLVLWENHQILAYGYKWLSDDELVILVYDPNHPADDGGVIQMERVEVGQKALPGGGAEPVYGLRGFQKATGFKAKTVRGFFPVTYHPHTPPGNL